jgi:antitoxin VapB
MALSIKTHEADALARALAAETHETLTEAVTVALRERLERVRRSENRDLQAAVARIQEQVRRAGGDARPGESDDDILGYDEHGLPT